jgi:adenosylcobinamide kinase/adenosylcobinamide-phosphate guanylyltransferase
VKELILGGARSGKSAHALQRARHSGLAITYVATATAGDEEMAARIARHRAERPADWQLVEEPVALATVLHRHAGSARCLVVDCLTLWLSNLLFPARLPSFPGKPMTSHPPDFEQERAALLAALPALSGHVIFVSNEVGLGLVPVDADTRRFRDEAGRLHQELAQHCDRVTWMVAGLPNVIKGG